MLAGFKCADERLFREHGGSGQWWVTSIAWSHETESCLRVDLQNQRSTAILTFVGIVSFRAHDEREILDYWAARDADGAGVSVIYTIEQSDYLAELTRGVSGILAEHRGANHLHYLVAGQDMCVEAITSKPPSLEIRSEQR